MKKLLALCGMAAAVCLVGCQNVAEIDTPKITTSTAVSQTTAPPTTSTTVATTLATTTIPTTAPTDAPADAPVDTPVDTPSVTVPEEHRSPNVTYFVPESARVTSSFFDDAVFVGDSVSLKLMYHNIATAQLGNATFLASGSLGIANAMWDLDRSDAVHPSLNGETVTVADGVARSGAKKLYFMLGINDLGLYGVDQSVENFKTIMGDILTRAPQLTVYIQSVTPLYADYGSLTNSKVNAFNEAISEYCRTVGWNFVDVASVMRDDSGRLRAEYCSDPDGMGIHFTSLACELWCEYLATHT